MVNVTVKFENEVTTVSGDFFIGIAECDKEDDGKRHTEAILTGEASADDVVNALAVLVEGTIGMLADESGLSYERVLNAFKRSLEMRVARQLLGEETL